MTQIAWLIVGLIAIADICVFVGLYRRICRHVPRSVHSYLGDSIRSLAPHSWHVLRDPQTLGCACAVRFDTADQQQQFDALVQGFLRAVEWKK